MIADPIRDAASTTAANALHETLLRAAGRLPDEVVAECRAWLAEGLYAEVAQALGFASITHGTALFDQDVALLTDLLVNAGENADLLRSAATGEVEPRRYGFAPIGPEVLERHRASVPYTLDLTRSDIAEPAEYALIDNHDSAVIGTVATGPGKVLGLWRAWRYPPQGEAAPTPRRIYLVLADDHLVEVMHRIQLALSELGDRSPQVEVFANPDRDLQKYQTEALEYAALIWAADVRVPLKVAPLYDGPASTSQTGFADDHPVLADPERQRVLEYLDNGKPLLIEHFHLDDIAADNQNQVSAGYRTDGEWIWQDAAGYYLEEYSLAPHQALLQTIHARGHQPPDVDFVTFHRALSYLYRELRRR